LISTHELPQLLFSPCPAEEGGVQERLGGRLAAATGQPTTDRFLCQEEIILFGQVK